MVVISQAADSLPSFNVCNHWIAGLLDAAGVPTAPVPATLPYGLLLDLERNFGRAVAVQRTQSPPQMAEMMTSLASTLSGRGLL